MWLNANFITLGSLRTLFCLREPLFNSNHLLYVHSIKLYFNSVKLESPTVAQSLSPPKKARVAEKTYQGETWSRTVAHMCGPSCWWTDGGEWEVGLERCTERREESHNIHACNINVSLYLHMHARTHTKWAGFPRGFKWCVRRLGAVITHTDFSKTNTPSQEKKVNDTDSALERRHFCWGMTDVWRVLGE